MIEIEYSKKGGLKNVSVQVGNKPICLICNNAVSGLKKCNIARHYFTARASAYVKYKDLFGREKVAQLNNMRLDSSHVFANISS